MSVFALADLHLSFHNPEKKMDAFGEPWIHYTDKMETAWKQLVKPEDLVLIPGDISWAMHPEDAKQDLEWIDQLPGTKALIRGNHDYWWNSLSKVQKVLPPSLHLIQNNAFLWNGIAIGGARLWDSAEYNFDPFIQYVENPRAKKLTEKPPIDSEAIFERELGRLETSLKALDPSAKLRIAMTHYPPISASLQDSRVSNLLKKYQVDICVFGHLHNVKKGMEMFGKRDGTSYYLCSADYINFTSLKIA